MDRKAIANETLRILQQGWYQVGDQVVNIAEVHNKSVKGSILIRPGDVWKVPGHMTAKTTIMTVNCPVVDAIIQLWKQGMHGTGVLNFASAKNPGGGFLNGAMAQEESLAASGGLYDTQCAHPEYYEANRNCRTMTYTDHAIYSPDVIFFRRGDFKLLREPVTASVLTLPAVNYGQVLLKGEDSKKAKKIMKERMKRALDIFAQKGNRFLILGAYGCGVFRNDPEDVALWWHELLNEEYEGYFEYVLHAVYDKSQDMRCYKSFLAYQGGADES